MDWFAQNLILASLNAMWPAAHPNCGQNRTNQRQPYIKTYTPFCAQTAALLATLTHWGTILLEKLTVSHLLWELSTINGTPTFISVTWYFSDSASWIGYTLITNLMHWLLFINKILLSSTCFEPQVLIAEFSLKLCTDRPPGTLTESDSTIFCMYTTVSSWRWAPEARNM